MARDEEEGAAAKVLRPGKVDRKWVKKQNKEAGDREKDRKKGFFSYKNFDEPQATYRILPPPEGQGAAFVLVRKHFAMYPNTGKAIVDDLKVVMCLDQIGTDEMRCPVCKYLDEVIDPSDRKNMLNRVKADRPQAMFNAIIRASKESGRKDDEQCILQTNDLFADWYSQQLGLAMEDGVDLTDLDEGRDIVVVQKSTTGRDGKTRKKYEPSIKPVASVATDNPSELRLSDLTKYLEVSDEDVARAKQLARGLRRRAEEREDAAREEEDERPAKSRAAPRSTDEDDPENEETPPPVKKAKAAPVDEEEAGDEDDDTPPPPKKKATKPEPDEDEEAEDDDTPPPAKKKPIKTAADAIEADDEETEKPRGWRQTSSGKVLPPKPTEETGKPVCFHDWVKRGNDPAEDESSNAQCSICPQETTCRFESQKRAAKKAVKATEEE